MVKIMMMQWAGHTSRMPKMRKIYKILSGKLKERHDLVDLAVE
jgi:hypothetical protein